MVPFYYVRTQEKVEIALLDMFNNLKVNKYTNVERTDFSKTVRVPIVIHQSSNFANWWSNANAATRPMPVPIAGLRFERKEQNNVNRTQSTYARMIFSHASDQWIRDIQPTPYYLYYTLEFLCDNLSDNRQINENVIPYFNTFRTLRINEFDFAPDIERKIPVYLQSVEDIYEDEIDEGSKKQWYKTKITLRLDVDWYRPFEIPELILYAELNLKVGDIIDKMQWFVYPDPIAEEEKKSWELLDPSRREGYTLLKTNATTLVVESSALNDTQILGTTNTDNLITGPGGTVYKIITPPDAYRPAQVPSFNLLHLNFDQDTPYEDDQSGFNRDFTAINDSTREFHPDLAPGAGNSVEDGYEVDPSVQWNRILNWFGDEDGEMTQPFTFKSILQFKEEPVVDTIFQYLSNLETVNNDVVIPEGQVWFDWGIIDSKLYFTFKTYGSKGMFLTYTTDMPLVLNNTDIYTFTFVLYDKGYSGIFGYSINQGPMIALKTVRN